MLRSSVFAAAAAMALVTAPAYAQVKWDLPSAYPADNFHSENLAAFARDVADVTGGKLAIKVYPNASLFPATAIKSAVRIGQAQVGEILLSVHEDEDPMFGIDVVPFLAASYGEARKLWLASKPAIERRLAAQGLMVLFAVPWPPQGIYAKKELASVADMRGLKWRAYSPATARVAELVGAQPVTVQAADLPQALATGVVESYMSSGSTGFDSKTYEHLKYWYDTQAWLPKNAVIVNKAAFNALDKPTQDALLKAAADAEVRGLAASKKTNTDSLDKLKANGMQILPPSPQLKADMKKVGETMLKEWLDKAGPEGKQLVDAFLK
jgi:TRAP-type C4-dicarboxylate transport system substrate-binding protein